jgi:Pentapeptide repeats (8 copies)
MANEDHLEILRQGVGAWNAWRGKNPLARPDLSGANLAEADFSGANFGGVLLVYIGPMFELMRQHEGGLIQTRIEL